MGIIFMVNTDMPMMYKISFVSGLAIEVALNQKELRELIHKKKISGYKVIATGIE